MHIPTVLSAEDAEPAHAALAQRILDGVTGDGFLRVTYSSGVIEKIHHIPAALGGDVARACRSNEDFLVIRHGRRLDRVVYLNLGHVASIAHEYYREDQRQEDGDA
ncbi:hypothetical protein [Paracoccus aminophilus]|uniref:Uncharacterized protein n=1 Tax=Paracoccus aminophilus JCM 7686 TaxID=1367847 RepID=S5YVR5_PARAH|nr:hypothetical protein [Paracoccus aminophilus]AGT09331.1 hypothetical protein JCM7686_2261 [Paracoccus aminophilus JCM 7686]